MSKPTTGKDPRAFVGDPYAAFTINGQPFPRSVRIGSMSFEITFTETPGMSEKDRPSGDLDEQNWGYISYWNHRIDINPRTAPEKWFAILVHEVLHGIEQDRKLDLKEKQIHQIANGLVDFLLDNDWITVERAA